MNKCQYLQESAKYYSKDPKKYHTWFHIHSMFYLYDLYRDEFLKEFPELNEDNLFQAIAWHDSVYIPGLELNEEFSAELYTKYYFNADVYYTILSTKVGNNVFDTPEKKVLHDLDWIIFSTDKQENLIKYQDQIIYESTCDEKFGKGEVLQNMLMFYQSLLNKDIFITKTFSKFNNDAKKNIQFLIQETNKKLLERINELT